MRRGVSPALLLEQVRNTARWALEPGPEQLTSSALDRLRTAEELETRWRLPESHGEYLGIMLAAHYTTVATFVPTDVDTHIRYHIWQELETEDALSRAIDVADEAAAWPVREVSARVVELPGLVSPSGLGPAVFGHSGEWLSVWSGALGRALALGADALVDRLRSAIEAEIRHEAAAFAFARARDPLLALRVATTIAHNTGDLSRVVEAWPKGTPHKVEHMQRYGRLGHGGGPATTGGEWLEDLRHELRIAGHVNKAVMAPENHRYLALREPRVLRERRAYILPLGPFFEPWATGLVDAGMSAPELASVLAAMMHGIDSTPGSTSYHRAIAELHRRAPGGIDGLAIELPAKLRKAVQRGPVREVLRIDPGQWDARLIKAWGVAMAGAG